MTVSAGQGQDNRRTWLRLTFLLLIVLYVTNCFTPLRLHYDTLRYFAIKDCLETGCPITADPHDYLPYGFTAVLLGLSKLGVLNSLSIVVINGLFLWGGLYFVRRLFVNLSSAYFLFVLVLMNWTVIKFFLHPLSEMEYLFFSLAGVYFFYTYTKSRKITHLLLSLVMAMMAFITRTVGIALFAAIAAALIWEYRQQLLLLIRKNKLLIAVACLCLAAITIFSKQLGLNHYTGVMSRQFQGGVRVSSMLGWHIREWGEIFLNISAAKAIGWLPSGLAIGLLMLIGLLALAGFIFFYLTARKRIPFIVGAYLFFYFILIFNWPFSDPRFWVPVIPLIAAVIAQIPWTEYRWLKPLAVSVFVIYALSGIFSVGYMTYTSLNKKVFAKTQAAGAYRNEYEIHFFGRPLSDTAVRVDPYVMSVLSRYDKN